MHREQRAHLALVGLAVGDALGGFFEFSHGRLSRRITERIVPQLSRLCTHYQYCTFQICCTAPIALLRERYVRRIDDGTRHRGHADRENIASLRTDAAAAKPDILALAGEHCIVDTTNDATLGYAALWETVQHRLLRPL